MRRRWDSSRGWSAALDRHKFFRGTHMEGGVDGLHAKKSDVWDRWEVGKTLWARVEERPTGKVGLSYKPASLDDNVGETFFTLFEEVSVS